MTMTHALAVILAHAAAALSLAWLYQGRYSMKPPPIGVINLWDIAFMMVSIVIIPYLYLLLPLWAVAGLLAFETAGVIYLLGEPVLRARALLWLIGLGAAAADIFAAVYFGPANPVFFAVNNAVLVLIVAAVANLWVQSGMKAREVSVLAGALIAYDYIFTSKLPLMADLVTRMDGLPFAPMVAWPAGAAGQYASLGLGDLLMLTAFPIAMRKAYGRTPALIAAALALAAVVFCFQPLSMLQQEIFPFMVILGPLTLAQYLFWSRRRGAERTLIQFLHAEPR